MELTQTLFNILIGLCGSLGTGVLCVMWAMIQGLQKKHEDTQKDISSVRTDVAGNYVRHDKLDIYITRLEEKIDKGFDRINDKLDKKADK